MLGRFAVVSVVGEHAGEAIGAVIERKNREIADGGKAFWLIKSFKAPAESVQRLGRAAANLGEPLRCFFVSSGARNGAKPTLHAVAAAEFSEDGTAWSPIPPSSVVTGKIDGQSVALVIGRLEVPAPPARVDLWGYSEFETELPVKMQLGASTVCCVAEPSIGMASRMREVVAVATLVAPYAVRLR